MAAEQRILEITGLTFGAVLILLVFAVLHRRHLNRITRQIAELPPNPEGTERILGAVDHSKDQVLEAVEGARMQISSTGDELRGQTGLIKERVQWLIGRIDALIATIAKFIKGVP